MQLKGQEQTHPSGIEQHFQREMDKYNVLLRKGWLWHNSVKKDNGWHIQEQHFEMDKYNVLLRKAGSCSCDQLTICNFCAFSAPTEFWCATFGQMATRNIFWFFTLATQMPQCLNSYNSIWCNKMCGTLLNWIVRRNLQIVVFWYWYISILMGIRRYSQRDRTFKMICFRAVKYGFVFSAQNRRLTSYI